MDLISLVSFITLSGIVLFLTVFGAGIFPVTVCISAGILCFSTSLCITRLKSEHNHSSEKIKIPALPILCSIAIFLLALTTIPLPLKVDFLTGSRRHNQNELAHSAVREAEKLGIIEATPFSTSITRNRAGTLRILVLLIAMLNAAILSSLLSDKMKKRYLNFLLIFITIVAVAGFLHQWVFPSKKTLWWIFKVAHGRPIGPFVNRSHFGGFIAMFCPMALAFAATAILNRKWLKTTLCATAFLIMSFSVICTLSRGALSACTVGVIVILISMLFMLRLRTSIPFIVGGGVLICALFTTIAVIPNNIREPVITRMETLREPIQTDSAQSRLGVWRASLKLWRNFPCIGGGANSFRMLYPQHRTTSERKLFHHAENEYIELLTDTGLIGTLLTCLIIVIAGHSWYRNIKQSALSREIILGVGGAFAVAATHNAVDFPMHIPLYAIVFASLIGLSSTSNIPYSDSIPGFRLPRKLIVSFTAIIGLLIFFFLGIFKTTPYKMDSTDYMTKSKPQELALILGSCPTSPNAWHYLGRAVFTKGNPLYFKFAEQCMTRSVEYDPNNYQLWEALGYARLNCGDYKGSEHAFERMHALRPWKAAPKLNTDKY
ncbi:O-antigen ligase family protein [Verrucomicrobiota bacterium]